MAAVHSYLNFNGNCEEAFYFYRSAFGHDFSALMRFKDIPKDIPSPPGDAGRIMHVALPIGHGTILMGSDTPESFGPVTRGHNHWVSIQADTEEEARKLFSALSAGGKLTMPLEKTFWGALFGMFEDKFGVQWMVNYQYEG